MDGILSGRTYFLIICRKNRRIFEYVVPNSEIGSLNFLLYLCIWEWIFVILYLTTFSNILRYKVKLSFNNKHISKYVYVADKVEFLGSFWQDGFWNNDGFLENPFLLQYPVICCFSVTASSQSQRCWWMEVCCRGGTLWRAWKDSKCHPFSMLSANQQPAPHIIRCSITLKSFYSPRIIFMLSNIALNASFSMLNFSSLD